MSENVEEFKSFAETYSSDWGRLDSTGIDMVYTELETMSTSVAQLYRTPDIFEGLGRPDAYYSLDTVTVLDTYVDKCCFPDLDCSDIDDAIDVINSAKNSFNIEPLVGKIYAGIDDWNTDDFAEVNPRSIIGVEEGPSKAFQRNYVETINPTASNQRDAMDAAVLALEAYKILVTENRTAILELIESTQKVIDEYNPWEAALLSSMHATYAAVGLVFQPIGLSVLATAADVISTKALEKLGVTQDACVVVVLRELKKSVKKLTKQRAEAITEFKELVVGLVEEAESMDQRLVCKRPSQLRA